MNEEQRRRHDEYMQRGFDQIGAMLGDYTISDGLRKMMGLPPRDPSKEQRP